MTQLGFSAAPQAKMLSRIALSGLVSALILASTSYLINVLRLGPAHEALDVFRPDSDPRIVPGLLFSSLLWGCLLAGGYRLFWRGSRYSGYRDGALYELTVFCSSRSCSRCFSTSSSASARSCCWATRFTTCSPAHWQARA